MLYQTTNPHGGDIYGRPIRLDYSVNTNPLGTPDSVKEAVVKAADELCRYPDPSCRSLISALSKHMELPEEYILCGNGAAELIFTYCNILQPKTALELSPTFSEYSRALESVGCRVKRYPLAMENDFRLTGDFLDVLRNSNAEILFLCNPNNPTGQLIEPGMLAEIVGICRECGIRLFLDECFLELSSAGRSASLMHILKDWPGLFLLNAFTKTYGMAGVRLGYGLCSDGKLLSAMSRRMQPWNVSLLAQKAGLAALQESDWLERARELIGTQRAFLEEKLRECGLYVCPSQANFLLFYSDAPLFDRLLEQGVLLRDCSNYSGLGNGWVRAAVKTEKDNRILSDMIAEVCREISRG